MPDQQSAELIPLVSREQAENAFRVALNMFVGRGKRHSSGEVSLGAGVPVRLIDCYRSYPFGHPDHRKLDAGQKLSIMSYVGADLTTKYLEIIGQAAFNLPEGEPDPGELAADITENGAKVVRMAADRDFSNDCPRALTEAGSSLVAHGQKLVALGARR